MSQLCFEQAFKILFTLRKAAWHEAWLFSWGKKLLTAELFMGDGCVVCISKCLECEQLPLLVSHKVS